MRDIRFRAWYPKTQCFHCVDYLILDNQTGAITAVGIGVDFSEGGTPIGDVELMQYTGLKDKNGKEIYEADLVRWDDGSNGTVVWNDELGCYLLGDGIKKFDYISWGKCEVVGNIYENS